MIYLDNAATSFPKAPGTAAAVERFLSRVGANAGRASHQGARESSGILFECREALAELLGCGDSSRIVFTSGTTEGLNLAILGMVRPGTRVLTSSMEHNSVMRPLRFLEETRDVRVETFGADSRGYPLMDEFREGLARRPDFLVFSAASNVTGAAVPWEAMSREASRLGIPVCVDGAQLAGSRRIHLESSGADLFAFPGHKGLLGPTGTGGLYIREGVNPVPLMFGGTGSRSAEERQPEFLPDRYESGTPNVSGIAGLLASVSWLLETGPEEILRREEAAVHLLREGLERTGGFTLHGPGEGAPRTAVVSAVPRRLSLADFTRELDRREVAVRMGLHCAPAAHRSLGTLETGGTVRFSPGCFTSSGEIEETLEIIGGILDGTD